MKQILIIGILVILTIIGIRIKQTINLQNYAKVHNCTWVSTGTQYGDDRDWTCKTNK